MLFEHAAWVAKPAERSDYPLTLLPLSTHTRTHTELAQFKHNHADQGVSHPHANERGGVPHCSALHDPGEWFPSDNRITYKNAVYMISN